MHEYPWAPRDWEMDTRTCRVGIIEVGTGLNCSVNVTENRPCACPLGIARKERTEWRQARWIDEQRTMTIETTNKQNFLSHFFTSYTDEIDHGGVLEGILYSRVTPCCSSLALAWSLASLLVFGSVK